MSHCRHRNRCLQACDRIVKSLTEQNRYPGKNCSGRLQARPDKYHRYPASWRWETLRCHAVCLLTAYRAYPEDGSSFNQTLLEGQYSPLRASMDGRILRSVGYVRMMTDSLTRYIYIFMNYRKSALFVWP